MISRLKSLPRFSFLLAGIALAVLIINGFLWYGAAQAPYLPYLPAHHLTCGQPVEMRAEDYDLWGSTRPGHDLLLARVDFCDTVQLQRADGLREVWFWLDVESVGQVYPRTGWGFPWEDVKTPFPADPREPRNPWWHERSSMWALAHEPGYTGGDGYSCPLVETAQRGLDLFFYRDGFQLPVGMHHAGWVCLYFDGGWTLPSAFTVSLQPTRARITQWVDKLIVVREDGTFNQPAIPLIDETEFCDHVRRTHPASIQPGGPCTAS